MALVEDFLDTGSTLAPEMEYRQLEQWDSLAVISFLAMVNVEYGKMMHKEDLAGTKTFRDLYALVKGEAGQHE